MRLRSQTERDISLELKAIKKQLISNKHEV